MVRSPRIQAEGQLGLRTIAKGSARVELTENPFSVPGQILRYLSKSCTNRVSMFNLLQLTVAPSSPPSLAAIRWPIKHCSQGCSSTNRYRMRFLKAMKFDRLRE